MQQAAAHSVKRAQPRGLRALSGLVARRKRLAAENEARVKRVQALRAKNLLRDWKVMALTKRAVSDWLSVVARVEIYHSPFCRPSACRSRSCCTGCGCGGCS